MLHGLVTKELLFVFCTLVCGFVCEKVSRINPNFFTCFCKISNIGAAMNFEFSTFLNLIPQKFAFFCLFCKVFTFCNAGNKCCKLTSIRKSTVPHNSVQFFCTPRHLLREFVLSWRTK